MKTVRKTESGLRCNIFSETIRKSVPQTSLIVVYCHDVRTVLYEGSVEWSSDDNWGCERKSRCKTKHFLKKRAGLLSGRT